MRVTKATVIRACAVCERTLLQGEYAVRFSPDGVEFVDVCPLCQEVAVEQGWLKEGSPTSPLVAADRPRRRLSLGSIFERARPEQREDEHGLAVHRLLGSLSVVEVDAVGDEALDVDTWEDLRRIREQGTGGPT